MKLYHITYKEIGALGVGTLIVAQEAFDTDRTKKYFGIVLDKKTRICYWPSHTHFKIHTYIEGDYYNSWQ